MGRAQLGSIQILCVMNLSLPDLIAENLSVLIAHSSVFREVGHALEDVCSSLMPLLLQVSALIETYFIDNFSVRDLTNI